MSPLESAETAKESVSLAAILQGGDEQARASSSIAGGTLGGDGSGKRQSCASSTSIEEKEKEGEKEKELEVEVVSGSLHSGAAAHWSGNSARQSRQSWGSSTSIVEGEEKRDEVKASGRSEEEGGKEEEWQRACDQATGKKYFWNLRTNEVRWFTEEEEGEAELAEEEGWERVLDQTTGKDYFWHNVTDEVRWTEPPELAAGLAATPQ